MLTNKTNTKRIMKIEFEYSKTKGTISQSTRSSQREPDKITVCIGRSLRRARGWKQEVFLLPLFLSLASSFVLTYTRSPPTSLTRHRRGRRVEANKFIIQYWLGDCLRSCLRVIPRGFAKLLNN